MTNESDKVWSDEVQSGCNCHVVLGEEIILQVKVVDVKKLEFGAKHGEENLQETPGWVKVS